MQSKKQTRTYLTAIILFGFVYFLTARLGLLLATINSSVSPVWPAIAIGAFAANILNPGTFASAASITVGNTLQALVASLF